MRIRKKILVGIGTELLGVAAYLALLYLFAWVLR